MIRKTETLGGNATKTFGIRRTNQCFALFYSNRFCFKMLRDGRVGDKTQCMGYLRRRVTESMHFTGNFVLT